MKRNVIVLMLALLLIPVIALAAAQDQNRPMAQAGAGGSSLGNPGRGMGTGMGGAIGGQMSANLILRLKQQLNLTDEQVASIRTKLFALKRDMARQRNLLELARIDLQELMAADKLDLKKAEAKIREIANLQAEIQIRMLRSREEIKGVLTPDQLKKLEQLRAAGPRDGGQRGPGRSIGPRMGQPGGQGMGPAGMGQGGCPMGSPPAPDDAPADEPED